MITTKGNELKNIKHLSELLEENTSDKVGVETKCFALWGMDSLEVPKEEKKENKKTDVSDKKEPSLDSSQENEKQEDISTETVEDASESNESKEPLLPILRLTKGLFSSFKPEEAPYSLYYAFQGSVYYDFTKESNVETLLRSNWMPSEDEWETAKKAIQMINKYGITKYNSYPAISDSIIENVNGHNILLVDQPIDDESVVHGNSNAESFRDMLFHVFDTYQFSNIYIKFHQDTIDGKKEGYLQKLLKENKLIDHPSIKVIDTHCNITSLFNYIDDVFVVTSQVGFEALLRGIRVTCYGMPFYSGWGLTNDMQVLTYPKPYRSLMDLFIALAMHHTLYLNPFTGKKGNILDLLEWIALQKRHDNRSNILFYKTELCDVKNIDKAFKADKKKQLILNAQKKLKKYDHYLMVANKKASFADISKHTFHAFINEGFLFPISKSPKDVLSVVVDYNGPYYDPNSYSDLDYMLNEETYTDYEKECADKFIEALRVKYLVESRANPSTSLLLAKQNNIGKKVIFAPGQDKDDDLTSVGGDITVPSDYYLLLSICQKEKNSVILYRPLEDSKIKKIKDFGKDEMLALNIAIKENNHQIVFVNDASISQCIDISDEVHVINHNCGIEAIMKSKKVVTYGFPFYGGFGFTDDKQSYVKPKRQLTLQEFVLGTYLLYPRYRIPTNDNYVNAMTALEYDREKDNIKLPSSFWGDMMHKIKSMF